MKPKKSPMKVIFKEKLGKINFIKYFRTSIQDIEISRSEFFLLFLIFLSICSIIISSMDIVLFFLQYSLFRDINEFSLGVYFGIFSGVIFAGIVIDYLKKKIILIKYLLTIEIINLIIQITVFQFSTSFGVFIFISFYITAFITTTLFLLFLTLFLGFSSVLERGRVFSYLFISCVIVISFISIINHIIIHEIPFIFILSLVIIGYASYYIKKNKNLEVPLIREHIWEESHINFAVIKYIFFVFFLSFTIGLTTPLIEVEYFLFQSIQQEQFSMEIFYITFGLICISSLIAIIMGKVFDFKGRLKSLSILILLIVISSLLYIFESPVLFLDYIVLIALYVAVIMAITLLVGDITKRKNFGKISTISFTLSICGIYFGISLKNFLFFIFSSEKIFGLLVLLGLLYICSVISLVILLNSKETLPHKEKEWYESLIHLYIIHKHGILIYEHPFIKQTDRIDGDLVSGGIIGLTTLLKEIMKGEKSLRAIDHGDMKLLLKYSKNRDVIFVLIIREDLLTLREKLDNFSEEFEKIYQDKLKNLEYIEVNEWFGVSKLVDKYFERKYFEILDFVNPQSEV
ncbi:MAG: hypothetical protein ACP6IY_00020 [Promethearchaeia archaeon]